MYVQVYGELELEGCIGRAVIPGDGATALNASCIGNIFSLLPVSANIHEVKTNYLETHIPFLQDFLYSAPPSSSSFFVPVFSQLLIFAASLSFTYFPQEMYIHCRECHAFIQGHSLPSHLATCHSVVSNAEAAEAVPTGSQRQRPGIYMRSICLAFL